MPPSLKTAGRRWLASQHVQLTCPFSAFKARVPASQMLASHCWFQNPRDALERRLGHRGQWAEVRSTTEDGETPHRHPLSLLCQSVRTRSCYGLSFQISFWMARERAGIPAQVYSPPALGSLPLMDTVSNSVYAGLTFQGYQLLRERGSQYSQGWRYRRTLKAQCFSAKGSPGLTDLF